MERGVRWLLQDKYNGNKTEEFYADVERLWAGEPVDYLIGWKEFLGCRIDLSQRPFIPREETEYWVEKVLADVDVRINTDDTDSTNYDSGYTKVLDIFSGSGCIGIAVLKHWPNSRVTFIDSEENCIQQIKINLELNNIPKDRSAVIRADILSPYPNYELPFTDYDIILANPPYVASDADLPALVKNHEPHKALYADSNGLSIIWPFLKQARDYLSPDGRIFMEYDPQQRVAIDKILHRGSYTNWKFHQDQFGKWRWVEIIS